MTTELLSLILNGVIMLLLAATVFFAARLSLHLKEFRVSRHGLDKLVTDLSQQVDKAERAIEGLKENARDAGRILQKDIDDARALSDELQLIIQSGNRLAERLEKGAVQGRPGQAASSAGTNGAPAYAPAYTKAAPSARDDEGGGMLSGFNIRDRELDDSEPAATIGADGRFPGEEDDELAFTSRAERELYEALKGQAGRAPHTAPSSTTGGRNKGGRLS